MLKANQTATINSSQMDTSSNIDQEAGLRHIRQQAEADKKTSEDRLAQAQVDHKKALEAKKLETTAELNKIKEQMEQQFCHEHEALSKASEQNLQIIMLKLCSLKEKQDHNLKEWKSSERALLDKIKASIDPIITSDKFTGQIGEGAKLKWLQEEITNYCPPTVNLK